MTRFYKRVCSLARINFGSNKKQYHASPRYCKLYTGDADAVRKFFCSSICLLVATKNLQIKIIQTELLDVYLYIAVLMLTICHNVL